MFLTGGLPPRHPAVLVGVIIIVIGYAIVFYEDHLRSGGQLSGRGGPLTLLISMVGIPCWVWFLLSMIGQPELIYETRTTLANLDTARSRLRAISIAGYALLAATLLGMLAFVWKYSA